MANEHIRTAAANLQRAAQDVHEDKRRLMNNIDTIKRDAASATRQEEQQIAQLQRRISDHNVTGSAKISAELQQHNLRLDIAQIKKNADQQEKDLNQQLHNLNVKEAEFGNLASHLNGIA